MGYLNSIDMNRPSKSDEYDDERLSIPSKEEEKEVQDAVTKDTSEIHLATDEKSHQRVRIETQSCCTPCSVF